MSINKKLGYLLLSLAGIFFAPYISSYFLFNGQFPADLFQFPPTVPKPKAPFNLIIFIIIGLFFTVALLLFFFPRLFGFNRVTARYTEDQHKIVLLPFWFYLGFFAWAIPMLVLTLHRSKPALLVNWAELPIFWGFTLMLDGLVYVRNNRSSLISHSPRELLGIGMVSISGWLIFEYLNFFVKVNWFYPMAGRIRHDEFLLYAVLGSSGLMPMAFEWYHLLTTSDFLNRRFAEGPRIRGSEKTKTALLAISFLSLLAAPCFPDHLFFVLWLAPMVILTVILERIGIWTPFTPLRDGNWSSLILFSLTYLIQGFLLECWNYLSAGHAGGAIQTVNPAYWAYSIPYVNVLHVFEMPLLGYLGYIPFGVYCWIWWISFSFLLEMPTGYSHNMHNHTKS